MSMTINILVITLKRSALEFYFKYYKMDNSYFLYFCYSTVLANLPLFLVKTFDFH